MEFFFEITFKLLYFGLVGFLASLVFVVFLYRKHNTEVESGYKKSQ